MPTPEAVYHDPGASPEWWLWRDGKRVAVQICEIRSAPQTGGAPQNKAVEGLREAVAHAQTGGSDAGERARKLWAKLQKWRETISCEDAQELIETALRSSHREGAEAMREANARTANSVRCRAAENEELINGKAFASMTELSRHSGFLAGQRHAAAEIEDAIRALPIPGKTDAG